MNETELKTIKNDAAIVTAMPSMNLVTAAAQSVLNMGADAVGTGLDKLVEAGSLNPKDKSLVMWFFGLCHDRKYSMTQAAAELDISTATLSRVFRANYEGSLHNICEVIRRYKHLTDERAKMMGEEFIETSIWNSIRSTCDLAITRQKPVRIVGVSQIGKTTALEEYKRRSDYLVHYCRLPASPSLRGVVETVADACGVSTRCPIDRLRRRVIDAIDHNTLLVVDEVHELAISTGSSTAMKVAEWLREIYDRTGCGLVLCGTRSMEDDLINGQERAWLDQLDQRCIRVLRLPTKIPDDDISLVATTYGFPAPKGDILVFLRTLRMNRLTLTLAMSSDAASKKSVSKDWKLFVQVYKTIFGEAK